MKHCKVLETLPLGAHACKARKNKIDVGKRIQSALRVQRKEGKYLVKAVKKGLSSK